MHDKSCKKKCSKYQIKLSDVINNNNNKKSESFIFSAYIFQYIIVLQGEKVSMRLFFKFLIWDIKSQQENFKNMYFKDS